MYAKVAKAQYASIPLVTALPSSADDNDEIVLTDSLSAGTYFWHLRYVAARSSNKWVFVGGSPMSSEVSTSESTTSSTYAALTTAGPSIAIPVAGDYFVEIGCNMKQDADTSGRVSYMSYDIGATGAVDADGLLMTGSAAASPKVPGLSWKKKKSGLTAVTLTAKYRSSNSVVTSTFEKRWMHLLPIAIGG